MGGCRHRFKSSKFPVTTVDMAIKSSDRKVIGACHGGKPENLPVDTVDEGSPQVERRRPFGSDWSRGLLQQQTGG